MCGFDPATTVLAHIKRTGHGKMGGKGADLFGVHACNKCHDVIDGRAKHGFEPDELRGYILDALIETQGRLLAEGLLIAK